MTMTIWMGVSPMHYEVVWPNGSLLRIFPTYDTALRCARFWWERGYACRIRKRGKGAVVKTGGVSHAL